MLEQVQELAGGLRTVGVMVGTSDLIDALNALRALKTPERPLVYAVLKSALVKEPRHFEAFDLLFSQVFFQNGAVGDPGAGDLEERLEQARWSPDPGAAYQRLAQELVEEYLQHRDNNWTANQEMLDLITSRIATQAGLVAMPGMSSGSLTGQGQGGQFYAILRRQVAGYQYRRRGRRDLLLPDSASMRQLAFSQATAEQKRQLRRLIRQLAKRIANRSAGMLRRGGKNRISFRRLWRKSLSSGGIPVELCYERPRKKRSRLFVLLDVSNSMRATVSFFLELLFALSEEFSRIRAFLFVNSLTEVTQYIDRDDLSKTVEKIVNPGRMGVSGPTDYGESLAQFTAEYLEEITRKTTVIILGDGRNNQFPTGEENLLEISRRCANLYWLNPEPPWMWGFGDSYMPVYQPYCHQVFECRNLEQLERFIQHLVLKE
ncbi:MAG: VWA domain-containing protein [Firmicutes bacterium]|nr:VWA domain-containing protein [Bacillota bacterium]